MVTEEQLDQAAVYLGAKLNQMLFDLPDPETPVVPRLRERELVLNTLSIFDRAKKNHKTF